MCKCDGGWAVRGHLCTQCFPPRDWEGFPAESVNSKRGLGRGPDLAP